MPLSVSTATGNGATSALVAQPATGWLVGNTLLAYVASSGRPSVLPSGWTAVAASSTGGIYFSLFFLVLTSAQGSAIPPFVLDQSTLDGVDVLANVGQFVFTAPAATAITVVIVEYPSVLVGGSDRVVTTNGNSVTPTWQSFTPTYNNELVCLAMLTATPAEVSPSGYVLDGTNVDGAGFVLDQSTLDDTTLLGMSLFVYNFDAQQTTASPTGAVTAGTGASGPWCTIGLALLPAQLAIYYIGVQLRFDLIR